MNLNQSKPNETPQIDPTQDDRAVDPRDITMKPSYKSDKDPEEIVEDPAVTPQMPGDPDDLRDDLSNER